MAKVQTYAFYLGERNQTVDTGLRVEATTPGRGLKLACEEYGVQLVSQEGRFGRTTDGRSCSAKLVHGGRMDYADARSNRFPGMR